MAKAQGKSHVSVSVSEGFGGVEMASMFQRRTRARGKALLALVTVSFYLDVHHGGRFVRMRMRTGMGMGCPCLGIVE